jgi:hypothetical protein
MIAILDLQLLPFNALLIISALVLFIGMFAILNLKFLNMSQTQMFSALCGGFYAVIYFIAIYNLVAVHMLTTSIVHYSLFSIFIVFAFLTSIFSGMFSFRPLQIVGLIIFLISAHFLLA